MELDLLKKLETEFLYKEESKKFVTEEFYNAVKQLVEYYYITDKLIDKYETALKEKEKIIKQLTDLKKQNEILTDISKILENYTKDVKENLK